MWNRRCERGTLDRRGAGCERRRIERIVAARRGLGGIDRRPRHRFEPLQAGLHARHVGVGWGLGKVAEDEEAFDGLVSSVMGVEMGIGELGRGGCAG